MLCPLLCPELACPLAVCPLTAGETEGVWAPSGDSEGVKEGVSAGEV